MVDRIAELFGDDEPVLEGPTKVTADVLPFGFGEPGAQLPAEEDNPFEVSLADDVPTALRVIAKDGKPLAQKIPRFNKEQIEDLLMVMLGEPLALTSVQMRNTTVIQRIFHQLGIQAIGGDLDAQKEILNRVMGKPQQRVQSLNVSATYADYLSTLEGDGDESDQS